MVRRLLLGCGLVLLIVALPECAHRGTQATELVLPSGEHIRIVDAHGDYFTDVNDKRRHVYYVGYETAHDFEDIPSLRTEARRVWMEYKPGILGTDYDTCVVTPVKQDAGGSEEGRPFYFTKGADGRWSLQP